MLNQGLRACNGNKTPPKNVQNVKNVQSRAGAAQEVSEQPQDIVVISPVQLN
jgi:hypothetical protein